MRRPDNGYVRIVLFSVLLSVCLVFQAGATMGAPARTVSIFHIWGAGPERQQVDRSVALFEHANPDIKVEQIIEGAGYRPKLMQFLAGDKPPDIFLWYPGFSTIDLVDRGVLAPITKMWNDSNLDYFFVPGARSTVEYKGELWNLPWGFHGNLVVYNKKLFDRLGLAVPKTLKEFDSVAQAIKKAGVYPLASGWKSLYRAAYPVEFLLPSVGGPEFYRKLAALEEDWDNSGVRDALEIWKKWVQSDFWYPDARARDWAEALGLLVSNRAAMKFIGTYAIPVLVNAGWKLGEDFDIFLFPQINTKYPRTITGPFDSWSMARKAPHPVEAQKLLAFLAQPAPQGIRAISHGGLVMNKFVTSYDQATLKVKKDLDSGAMFIPGFFQATPPVGLQQINFGAMPDFYDDTDVRKFITRANAARQEYQSKKGK